jgi:histidinol-phosphate phosphatase family protein
MSCQAVILCGGLGQRLRPITLKTPKPLALVNGRPFIEYLLEQLREQGVKNVLLLTGYLGELIKSHIGDGSKFKLNVSYSHGPAEWSTGRRIWEAKNLLSEEFILLYSDNFAIFQLKKLKNLHNDFDKTLTLTVVPKTPGNISLSNNGVAKIYNNKRSCKLSHVEIGYMYVNKKNFFCEFDDKNCCFSDLIHKLVIKKKISVLIQKSGYHSISTLDRLILMEKYLKPKKILLIDRDGTINHKTKKAKYINSWSEFNFIPNTRKFLIKLASQGFKFIVITNQAGVAKGITKETNLKEIHNKMIQTLAYYGVEILKVYTCTHDWNEGCDCRKPEPGLFFKASNEFFFRLDKTCFIGDDERDLLAAQNAGCKGILINKKTNYLNLIKSVQKGLI